MQIKRNRMGRIWVFMLQGIDFDTALAKAEKEIDKIRESIKIEALKEFDELSMKQK